MMNQKILKLIVIRVEQYHFFIVNITLCFDFKYQTHFSKVDEFIEEGKWP